MRCIKRSLSRQRILKDQINGSENQLNNKFVQIFNPETWTQVQRFLTFFQAKYSFTQRQQSAIFGVEGQFNRVHRLIGLIAQVIPSLEQERRELEKNGISNGERSKELAALVESIYVGLYSVLDCVRGTISAIYAKSRGISSKSTSKLFKNAQNGLIEETVPKEIRDALSESDWFSEFQNLRTIIIHFNPGSCSFDSSKNKLTYLNNEVHQGANPLVIDDVASDLNALIEKINVLLDRVFRAINCTLNDDQVLTLCGTYKGRLYQRSISLSDSSSFDSGVCESKKWFDNNANFRCPVAKECGAYRK